MDNDQIRQIARGDLDDASRLLYFSTPFDILNAAVSEHLDRAAGPLSTVIVKESTATRACYVLEETSWMGYGIPYILGEVRVRVLPSQQIELRLINPPRPDRRNFTYDETTLWVFQPDEDAKNRAYEEISAKIETEWEQQYKLAQVYHQSVMNKFLRSLFREFTPLSDSEGEATDRAATATQQSVKRGGRPRQGDDDWAWNQIHVQRRPQKEILQEWRQRNEDNDRFLKDEERSWRSAIDQDGMKKQRRRKPE